MAKKVFINSLDLNIYQGSIRERVAKQIFSRFGKSAFIVPVYTNPSKDGMDGIAAPTRWSRILKNLWH